jgi:hypothetical protein
MAAPVAGLVSFSTKRSSVAVHGAPELCSPQCWSAAVVFGPVLLVVVEELVLEDVLLVVLEELLPLPSQTTMMLWVSTSLQLGAPEGTVPSATVSAIVTGPGAVQVKVVDGLPPAPLEGEKVPLPGAAAKDQVSALGSGPVDEPVTVMVPPTTTSPTLSAIEVTRPQSEKLPPTVTLPPSQPSVRQLANAVTLAVASEVTMNGAGLPVQVTAPSVDTPLITTLYAPAARPAVVPRLIETVPSG